MVLFVFHYSDTVRHLVLVYQLRFKGLCCSKINKSFKLKAPALKKKQQKKATTLDSATTIKIVLQQNKQ